MEEQVFNEILVFTKWKKNDLSRSTLWYQELNTSQEKLLKFLRHNFKLHSIEKNTESVKIGKKFGVGRVTLNTYTFFGLKAFFKNYL